MKLVYFSWKRDCHVMMGKVCCQMETQKIKERREKIGKVYENNKVKWKLYWLQKCALCFIGTKIQKTNHIQSNILCNVRCEGVWFCKHCFCKCFIQKWFCLLPLPLPLPLLSLMHCFENCLEHRESENKNKPKWVDQINVYNRQTH